MIRRIFSVILVFALMMAMLMGCSQSGSNGDGSAEGKKSRSNAAMIMVGISMTKEDESTKAGETLKTALEEAGHTVELAYADSAETQTTQISAMVEDGASVLVVDPLNSKEVKKTLQSITVDVSDVMVISYGSPIGASTVDGYVGPDYYTMGQQQAQHVIEQFGLKAPQSDPADQPAQGDASASAPAKGDASAPAEAVINEDAVTVELIAGNGADKAVEGAMSVLKPYIDAGLVAVPSGNLTGDACFTDDPAARAKELCSQLYTERELGALLCLGKDQAAAASDALLASYRGSAFPVITGYGDSPEALQHLTRHLVSMFSVSDTSKLPQLAIEAVATATDRTNMEDVLLDCTAVTLKNYKEVLFETGLYTQADNGSFVKNG